MQGERESAGRQTERRAIAAAEKMPPVSRQDASFLPSDIWGRNGCRATVWNTAACYLVRRMD